MTRHENSANGRRGASVHFEGPLMVASDGTSASDAAVTMAARLVASRGAVAELVSVLAVAPPITTPPYPAYPSAGTDALDGVRRQRRLQELARQVSVSAGAAARWPIALESGDPARAITDLAARRGASLIVTGLSAHGPLDRVLGGETALEIMRRSTVPVLSVVPTLTALPRHVIVAVDFSRASLRAARAVLPVLASDARLLLVHVRPDDLPADEVHEGYGVIYSHGVVGAFARLRRELRLPPTMRTETIFLQGDPAAELHALARRTDADLIAIGSHRHGLLDRLRLGTVTARLAREAPTSLFVSPPAREQR